jgi:glutaredoxin-like YruB-family protein
MRKKVVVYGTSTCPYCVRARQFLEDNNIDFEDIDVSADPEKVRDLVEKTGQMGVPVVDIDGEIIVGFDKEKISQALEL